jgi:hypothetical protein
MIYSFVTGPSNNQPELCSSATWNPNAITFANRTTVGTAPPSVFVSINNIVYATAQSLNLVQVWLEGSLIPTTHINVGLSSPHSVYASTTGDVYIDNGLNNNRVDKWTLNATSSVVAMYVSNFCFGLFIDINDNLYCSIGLSHQVVKTALDSNTIISTVVAGNGTAGSTANMLSYPRGIFVDIKNNLYVADCSNNSSRKWFIRNNHIRLSNISGA